MKNKHIVAATSVLLLVLLSSCGNGALRFSKPQEGAKPYFAENLRAPSVQNANSSTSSPRNQSAHISSEQTWLLFDTQKEIGVHFDQILSHAEAWFASKAENLGLELDPFSSATVSQPSDDLVAVNWQRQWNGLRVRNAFVELSYSRDSDGMFRVREIVNRSLSSLAITNADQAASNIGDLRDSISAFLQNSDWEKMGELHYVIPVSFDSDSEPRLVKVSEFKVRVAGEIGYRRIIFRDGSTEILDSSRDIYTASISAKTLERSYLDGGKTIDFPLAHGTYSVNGTEGTLDADGGFTTKAGGATILLKSAPITVVNTATPTQPYSFTTDLGEVDKVLTGATPEQARALTAYSSIQRIRRFALQFVKTTEAANIRQGPVMKLNDSSGICNAYFDPDEYVLVFFAQGSSQGTTCANTAEVNDVVYHEWGHSLDFALGTTPGIMDGSFSEGIGDIVAAYMTGSSSMGSGFFLNSQTPVRQLQNAAKYPPANTQAAREVHTQGLIIGGAFWDLRTALITRYGELKGGYYASWLFFRHLTTTDAYINSYQAVLRLDDDDGNAATRSPNHCLINRAFFNHGLATNDNCTDTVVERVPIAGDLVLGIKSETNGKAVMLASSPSGIASVKLCVGERLNCLEASKYTVEMGADGSLGNKSLYRSKTEVSIGELVAVTIGKFDAQGALLGARTFRVSAK